MHAWIDTGIVWTSNLNRQQTSTSPVDMTKQFWFEESHIFKSEISTSGPDWDEDQQEQHTDTQSTEHADVW